MLKLPVSLTRPTDHDVMRLLLTKETCLRLLWSQAHYSQLMGNLWDSLVLFETPLGYLWDTSVLDMFTFKKHTETSFQLHLFFPKANLFRVVSRG